MFTALYWKVEGLFPVSEGIFLPVAFLNGLNLTLASGYYLYPIPGLNTDILIHWCPLPFQLLVQKLESSQCLQCVIPRFPDASATVVPLLFISGLSTF